MAQTPSSDLVVTEHFAPEFRVLFAVSAVLTAGLGVWAAFDAVVNGNDQSVGPVGVVVLTVLIVIVIPVGLVATHFRLRVDDESLSVAMWPLPGTTVPRDRITSVGVVTVDPLRDYKGWGVKGSKRDRLYGGAGTEALRVDWDADDGPRKLTFLTSRAAEVADRLGAPVPAA